MEEEEKKAYQRLLHNDRIRRYYIAHRERLLEYRSRDYFKKKYACELDEIPPRLPSANTKMLRGEVE